MSTYVSAPGIIQQISALQSDLMALQSDLETSLPEDRNRCINELWVETICLNFFLIGSPQCEKFLLVHENLKMKRQGKKYVNKEWCGKRVKWKKINNKRMAWSKAWHKVMCRLLDFPLFVAWTNASSYWLVPVNIPFQYCGLTLALC